MQQKLTGDPGADFRKEAYTYIAGSLTNIDFTGPPARRAVHRAPRHRRHRARQPKAELKLHVAIDRVKDPQLIPQDKPWTIEIYKRARRRVPQPQPVQQRHRDLQPSA